MDSINDRLNKFSALVLHDAAEKRDKLIEETESRYQSIISVKEDEYLQEAYETIQRSKSESKRKSDEELLQAQMDSKKKILSKREEIINDVMDSVKKKLIDFAKTENYAQWLVKIAQKAVSEAGAGEKTIYVSEADMCYKENLAAIEKEITVEAVTDARFSGGVRVYNKSRRVSVDYSFNELLEEEKQSFLQGSGLALR